MFSMIRRFIFSILLAQWIYAEALLVAPATQPVLDTITQFLRPPTHDKWIATYKAFQEHQEQVAAGVDSVSELSDDLKQSVSRFAQQDRFHSMRFE